MGASLSALGRCVEAASALQRAARQDGAGVRDARAHAYARTAALQYLGALHAAQGRHRRALQEYQQALTARPPDYRPQVTAFQILFILGTKESHNLSTKLDLR